MARTLAEQAEAERKQDLAWRLHLAGATPQEIAASKDPDKPKNVLLFKDARGAVQAIAAARRRYDADAAELPKKIDDEIARDVAKLDRLMRALWPAATAGDVSAVREIRQLTQLRSVLLGYSKGSTEKKVEEADPIDELAKKRDKRRAGGA